MATYKKSINRDRLLGYGNDYCQSTDVDFDEEDVWMMSSEHSWIQPKSSRAHPARMRRRPGGLSMEFDEAGVRRGHDGLTKRQTAAAAASTASASMNVPVWSSMVRAESNDSMNGSVELGREEREWVPPHEYSAREHKKMTKSVFEGVGRTLKGHDLSLVRDAVWSQTGFFG